MLRKVIEWCEHHRNDPVQTNEEENDARKKTTDIDEWDQKFMQVDQEMLFEIILVSRPSFARSSPFADIPSLTPKNRQPTTWISRTCSTSGVKRSPT